MSWSWNMAGWGIAGVLALTLGGGCLWFQAEARQARQSAALWESSARGAGAALADLELARSRTEQALEEHQARVRGLESERKALRARLREAEGKDEEVRRWGDNPLPDAVRVLLAEGGSSHAGSSAADSVAASAGAHAGAGVSGAE